MEFLKDNITVLDICISNNKEETIEWLGNKKTVSGYTLTQLINICGGKVDFIKPIAKVVSGVLNQKN